MPDEEARILALLAAHGQPVLRVPFEAAAYARAGWDTGLLPDAGPLAGRQLRSLRGRIARPSPGPSGSGSGSRSTGRRTPTR